MKAIVITIIIILFISSFSVNNVLAFSSLGDLIFNSAPGLNTDHTIIFRNIHEIPASGRIVITPQAGQFFIMPDFDYTDVDLATSSSRDGEYAERTLADLPSGTNDGVSVIASTTNGSIVYTLNSSYGIGSDEYVRIKLGAVAIYQDIGDRQILNPVLVGPYNMAVETYSDSGQLLDDASALVFVIEPIAMSITLGKVRANGTPDGALSFGTTQSIMSLTTNYSATCRFATTSSTTYAVMNQQFSYTGNYFHSYVLVGLTNGSYYTYYVRCRDSLDIDDDTDFIISFMVSAYEGTEGETTGVPGGGGGGRGGGGGGGSGSGQGRGTGDLLPYPLPPGSPSVILQGLSYQDSQTILLQDGTEKQTVKADSKAQFLLSLYDLTQGVYTFGIRAEDQEKRKSLTQSFTFWLREGTKTEIYKIFIPPTIELSKATISAGESVQVFGRTAPGANIEAWMYPQTENSPNADNVVKINGQADPAGKWSVTLDTAGKNKGIYKIKAKASVASFGQSDFGKIMDLAIGVLPGTGVCPGADLNKDGKVNLFDFSILLYYWGTDNACADQNQDGIVNLIDFSIMMYYWTG